MLNYFLRATIAGSMLLPLAACGGDDGGTSSGPDAAIEDPDMAALDELWTSISRDYTSWNLPAAFPQQFNPPMPGSPHQSFIRIYANTIAFDGIDALPDGSVLVKHVYDTQDETSLKGIAIMQRRDGYAPDTGNWFWGMVSPEGEPMMAGDLAQCTDCHAGAEGGDYAFANDTNVDQLRLEAVWNQIGDQYTTWQRPTGWEGDHIPSDSPHGSYVRIFINTTGAADQANLPADSILVKHGYDAQTEESRRANATVMVRLPGFDPDHGDWLWGRVDIDQAQVLGAGRIDGCITCHAGAGGSDYSFINDAL